MHSTKHHIHPLHHSKSLTPSLKQLSMYRSNKYSHNPSPNVFLKIVSSPLRRTSKQLVWHHYYSTSVHTSHFEILHLGAILCLSPYCHRREDSRKLDNSSVHCPLNSHHIFLIFWRIYHVPLPKANDIPCQRIHHHMRVFLPAPELPDPAEIARQQNFDNLLSNLKGCEGLGHRHLTICVNFISSLRT